jgi:hypothetical protein
MYLVNVKLGDVHTATFMALLYGPYEMVLLALVLSATTAAFFLNVMAAFHLGQRISMELQRRRVPIDNLWHNSGHLASGLLGKSIKSIVFYSESVNLSITARRWMATVLIR